MIFSCYFQRFYIPTSRQLKRVESTTRSPIYSHFSETITGASTIRAYREQTRFITKSDDLVDHNLVFYFASIASNRLVDFLCAHRAYCYGAVHLSMHLSVCRSIQLHQFPHNISNGFPAINLKFGIHSFLIGH